MGLEVRLLAGGRPPGASAASEAPKGEQAENSSTANLDTEGGADAVIGRVFDLIHAGNDLLEVERTAAAPGGAGRRVFIPFVEAIVPVVNLAEGWIGITPPPGLLEL